ncbi:MAG: AraC family transcriptional regulator [bacterium]|nr:AraC family transcriptional regulator [bacterium]
MGNKSTTKGPTPSDTSVRNSLVPLIEKYALAEGVTETKWPGLVLGRSSQPVPRFPLLYVPSLCVVAQGRKHVYVADDRIIYDPLHYLVVTLPMPLEAEIVTASPEEPFLSLALEIDVSLVGKLLLEMAEKENRFEAKINPTQAIYASEMNADLLDAHVRLLRALENRVDRRVLVPGAVREILYHILKGDQGSFLRALALQNSSSHRIAQIVRFLQENYNQSLDISSIARFAGMGNSTLHHIFDKIVGQSPIQYLKKIRLHQARLMIVSNGLNASEAAYRVGYNNASQFSREFKRQFGMPPSRAAEIL